MLGFWEEQAQLLSGGTRGFVPFEQSCEIPFIILAYSWNHSLYLHAGNLLVVQGSLLQEIPVSWSSQAGL